MTERKPVPRKQPSLKEYVANRGVRHSAVPWMETLPPEILAEVVEGWKDGIGQTPLCEWLIEMGYPEASTGKIQNYLSTHYPRTHQ